MSDPKDEQIERLTVENEVLKESSPWLSNKTRATASELLGPVSRHRDAGLPNASHGCVEVQNATNVVESLVAESNAFKDQIERLKEELEAYKTGCENSKCAENHWHNLWTLNQTEKINLRGERDTLRAEVARLKEALDLVKGEAQHANQEIDEIVKQRDETIARLTAERDELTEQIKGNGMVRCYKPYCDGSFEYRQKIDKQAAQLAELRKDGERKASLLAQAYCWVGVNNPIVSPRDEEVKNLKFALKPYWEALDAARKKKP